MVLASKLTPERRAALAAVDTGAGATARADRARAAKAVITTDTPHTNAELWARRQNAVARGVAAGTQVFAARAKNAYMWDVEGKRYIDFVGAIGVMNAGHRNRRAMARAQKQMGMLVHSFAGVMMPPSYVELCERLNALAPIPGEKRSLLLTGGAEALENAVKIARKATGRSGVITFGAGFHGRSLLTMAMTGKMKPYKDGFGPFPPEIFHAQFPDAYHGDSVEDSLKDLDRLFKTDIDPKRVAAIVFEPVQGEGGFRPAPLEFIQRLRALCDQHGILLIADEVQSGFGRTGTMFAIEHSGVAPDIITSAKSIADGMPLAAVIGRKEIIDAVEPGGLGSTGAGNAVACEAALGVLESFEKDNLLPRARAVGEHLTRRLSKMAESIPAIGEVRGLGAMVAIELVKDRETKAPDADLVKKVKARALEQGLLLLNCGMNDNVLRILVPLTAPKKVIDEGLDILERTLKEVSAG
jgi:4-aminobutyrate aminotransferase